ncbi:MAG: hypothetical protein NUV76_10275 [Candidatus Kuenenia sp.]|nr:hypothetical protein [Candidatus Kuenenia sp.]
MSLSNFATKTSSAYVLFDESYAPVVIGKSGEKVAPVMYTLLFAPIAIELTMSDSEPPM